MDLLPQILSILGVLTIVGQILILFLVISLLWEKGGKKCLLTRLIESHALPFMFLVALIATGGSLFFSEIVGLTPCKLCWLQRIFMYPQAVILLIALWKKDTRIAPYILALSAIGIVIALFHYNEQVQLALHPVTPANPLQPCDASGTSCATTQIHFLFGYITIPLMAFTAFTMNALAAVTTFRHSKIH